MLRLLSRTCTPTTLTRPLTRTFPAVPVRRIFIPLSSASIKEDEGSECTLYIKGFLAKGEHADHFESWRRGHKVLIDTHNWGNVAHGYFWDSGDLPGSLVPYATLLTGAYHLLALKKIAFTPQGIALTAAAEAAVIAGKFWYEFKKAADTAKAHGPHLAAHIREISSKYKYIRIVAHSLGCSLLMEALKVLPETDKPHEIHFLAPVLDDSALYHGIAKEHAYLYHCGTDFALQTASTLFYQQKHVVGLAGPAAKWHGLTAVDVSSHFGFFVHTNYRNVLDKIIVDHRKVYAATSISLPETQQGMKSVNSEILVSADSEIYLSWTNEREKQFLQNLESELLLLEKTEVEDTKTLQAEKNSETVQSIVGSRQKIGGAIKDGLELLQVGKAFLGNIKDLLESRKDILEKAKSLAGAVIENAQSLPSLGKKK